ncbi:MAG: hypothetical protein MR266_03085 [Erysipelotrichaceae bacterium]|nr:hypothetical protein [Erysipelotrichaceae bacterium]
MIYIYDIILNFNSVFYEFYEWDSKDNLTFIRKIPLVKVDTNFINDILTKKVVIDDPIVLEITNKCEITSCKKANKIKYACLFTDSLKVIGVILNDKKQIIKVSDLLLDEANDVINISKRTNIRSITYNILENKNNEFFLTKKEIKIKNYLQDEIQNIQNKKDFSKLSYLYFEYFNKIPDNNCDISKELLNSFKNNLTTKHIELYELLKLIHQ